MEKKTRADSKLKVLPEERQGSIFEYASDHTLVETVAWLAEDGVRTSKTALGEFLQWYSLRQQFASDEETTETVLEELKREASELSDEQLDVIGQRTFALLSLRRKDAETFLAYRSARSKGELEKAKLELRRAAEQRLAEKASLEREKWVAESCGKILKAATDSKTREIAESNVPNEEKIRLLRQHWFADVEELEKSGRVKLPE